MQMDTTVILDIVEIHIAKQGLKLLERIMIIAELKVTQHVHLQKLISALLMEKVQTNHGISRLMPQLVIGRNILWIMRYHDIHYGCHANVTASSSTASVCEGNTVNLTGGMDELITYSKDFTESLDGFTVSSNGNTGANTWNICMLLTIIMME